jgi:hypothetical protein
MQKLGHEPHFCQKHKAQSMTQGEHETKEKKNLGQNS